MGTAHEGEIVGMGIPNKSCGRCFFYRRKKFYGSCLHHKRSEHANSEGCDAWEDGHERRSEGRPSERGDSSIGMAYPVHSDEWRRLVLMGNRVYV